MTAPDVVQKRNEWLENIDSYDADTLVFLDESGVNIDMTRRYGRAVGKARAVDKTPESTPTNTTILSSVRLNGDTAYTTYMDNLRSHHVKAVAEVLAKAEVKLLYLPPYSPDFNPIEKMWSKIKSILRKLKARTLDALPDAIETAFSAVHPSDCMGWFKSCFVSC